MLVIGLAIICAFVLFVWQDKLISKGMTKHIIWTIWGCLFAVLLLAVIIQFFWQRRKLHKEQRIYRPEQTSVNQSSLQQSELTRNIPDIRKEICSQLKQQYGSFWFRKINIFIITGLVSDVEQLTPGLTSQYWQEDSGTLLLWGGVPERPVDANWFGALRKLRHRPADGIVWVTTALVAENGEESAVSLSEDNMDNLSRAISERYKLLGWRLPLYVWSLHPQANAQTGRATQPVGCLLPARCRPEALNSQLQALIPALVTQGVQQICTKVQYDFLLTLATRLTHELHVVSAPLSTLLNPYRPLPLAGIVFSPTTTNGKRTVPHHWGKDNRWDVLPVSVQALPAGLRPRKPGVSWQQALAIAGAALMVLWGAGMVVAFTGNRSLVSGAQEQVQRTLDIKQPVAQRLQALAELQKTLTRLQYRAEHGVPWYLHAGLSQNNALLTAVFPRYAQSALPLLRDGAAQHLQQQLTTFVELPPDSPQRSQMAKTTYDQLKLYLMLAQPQHMDAGWFSTVLLREWQQREGVSDGVWLANAQTLLAFYGAELSSHPQWKLSADEGLISQARTLLVRQMGVRNSDTTLYQKMLAQVAHQYADMRLADMTGDTDASRLFTTDEVVPGMFTRQAWEDAVQPAIERVANDRREEIDWVLSDGNARAQQQGMPEVLKQRLTEHYFADFGGAWLTFLNSLRWQRAATLSDAIDQLTLMADVRQSPLVALMNTLNVQGRTGQSGEAITDSLIKSAKNMMSGDKQPVIDQNAMVHGPLDATFGPVLALMDNQKVSRVGSTVLSLQTFLTRVTQVRLRLQQVTNATDPQAMTQALAQTVFQGKAVDLTETRDYGSLMAAGLGQEWSGFGQSVFVRPMEQAWQQVLTPAAESLNAQWRAAVVDDWNSTFAGRYPFKNVSSDVSLPLLAKYLNTDSGRISRFLQSSLNGVLHQEGNRWVPDSINAQGLNFNPAFLHAVNTLSQIADVVFTNGEAGLHFDLRPGTAAGVMQTTMIIDGQKLVYVNQMPAWKRFTWPGDTEAPGASLSWISTQTGTRLYADLPGNWGFIRLLDKANVQPYPGVSSSFSLSWKAQDGRALNYTLRTEAGSGPLALLKLRNFTLPDTIFSVSASSQSADNAERVDDVDAAAGSIN
jgi:type VI secretion system protein ImpL